MYSRSFNCPSDSYFLFGPRGTGKSSLIELIHPSVPVIDLLEAETYNQLLANPQRLGDLLPKNHKGWVVIDEVQKVPALLDEVHRLIEKRKLKFAITGSSARKLKRQGVNLLAGRALTHRLYPLTACELGKDFNVKKSLIHGHLPKVYSSSDPSRFLKSYIQTYLKEEVQQEGLTRNVAAFARFLEAASFSQAQLLSVSAVSRECAVHRKVVEEYFSILRDLLLSYELPVFTKKAKRKMTAHQKFFFFDVGVYRAIRPAGPLDSTQDIDGPALETLVLQELIAHNEYRAWDYEFYHWRAQSQREVDFVMYGKRGFHAIEVKRTATIREADLRGLAEFAKDYPAAKLWIVYGGTKRMLIKGIEYVPASQFMLTLPELF